MRIRRCLLAGALVGALLPSVLWVGGCERRVIREKAYSPAQFPEYRDLPRANPWDRQADYFDGRR